GRVCSGSVVQDFTYDAKLPRVDDAIQHPLGQGFRDAIQRNDVSHAVGATDCGAGAVGVCGDTYPYVQVGVTIDQIVAAAPFDKVASTPAQEDVAAREDGLNGARAVGPVFAHFQQVTRDDLVESRDPVNPGLVQLIMFEVSFGSRIKYLFF